MSGEVLSGAARHSRDADPYDHGVVQPSFDARRQSFGAGARAYDRFRPGYPELALEWLFDGARREIHEVADVGAGTGILTRQLIARGLDVVAVEPDGRMLEHLSHTTPLAARVRSSAESIDLGDDAVDAVTADMNATVAQLQAADSANSGTSNTGTPPVTPTA